MGEESSYSVCGAECYFEFCLSKDVGNVGRLLAYIGEGGPILLCCAGCCWSYWIMGGGFLRLHREGIIVQNVVHSFIHSFIYSLSVNPYRIT